MLAAVRTYGVNASITRGSNTYGPHQYPEKFLPLFTTNALDGEALPLYGDGRQIRDWLHVEDHCAAIELVLREGDAGEVYNVGANEEHENVELTRVIVERLGVDPSARPPRRRPRRTRPPLFARDRQDPLARLGAPPRLARRSAGDDRLVPRTAATGGSRSTSGEYREYYEKQYAARLGERLAAPLRVAAQTVDRGPAAPRSTRRGRATRAPRRSCRAGSACRRGCSSRTPRRACPCPAASAPPARATAARRSSRLPASSRSPRRSATLRSDPTALQESELRPVVVAAVAAAVVTVTFFSTVVTRPWLSRARPRHDRRGFPSPPPREEYASSATDQAASSRREPAKARRARGRDGASATDSAAVRNGVVAAVGGGTTGIHACRRPRRAKAPRSAATNSPRSDSARPGSFASARSNTGSSSHGSARLRVAHRRDRRVHVRSRLGRRRCRPRTAAGR